MKLGVVALAAVTMLTACGEAGVFDGVGDRTREVVRGSTTTTTSAIVVGAGIEDEAVISVSDVLWFNDDIDPQIVGTPDIVIAGVWDRQLNSRFVQSARAEIAAALPTIVFPADLPQQVRWVTSQLVYNQTSGTLDTDTSAAFGLWTAEPYQTSTAQLGVLRVGQATGDIPSVRSDISAVAVPDGVSLGWTEGGLRYELFCRSEVSEDLCLDVAGSSALLSSLLP